MPGFDLDKNGGSGEEAIPSSQPVSRRSSFKSFHDYPKVDNASGMTQNTMVNGYSAAEDGSEKPEEEPPKNEEVKMVGWGEVFRFADAKDKVMMLFGTLFAAAHGAALPLMIVVFGEMTDMFINDATMDSILDLLVQNCSAIISNCTKDDLIHNRDDIIAELISLNQTELVEELEKYFVEDMMGQMSQYAIYYAILGTCVIALAYVQISFWLMASYRQTQRIRKRLFGAILRQDIGWFDTHEVGELNTRLSDDVNKIQAGIGDKLGMFWQWFAAFITGFVIGFVYGWELTLVILAVSPLLVISGAIMSKMGATMASQELQAYAKAGAVAEEVFSSIRTVYAFSGQKKECARYNEHLVTARDSGIKRGMVNGLSMGFIYLIMFCSYALAFWYGSQLVRDNERYTAGSLLIVFFSVLIGAFSLGNAAPNLQDFATARGAAYVVYNIIDLEPEIDNSSPEGLKPDKLEGNIRFENVVFQYPSRPEVTVLNGLNLSVSVGETVALVGSSGCGKSTTVQLLQRFYDPQEGVVKIDGRDIREYNVKWLRQQIGVVSQEPILFGTTIEENIRYGRDGVTQDEIDEAAIKANAHSFIMKLPKQYKTMVGERGAQLSGGQKQRIAIARALVRDPKILLLDEATSALDTESEATVQAALDTARLGRTTIVVAHRLSTVKTADLIAGFSDGKVVENGNHETMMKIGGVYYQLVTNQTMKEEKGNEELEYDLPSFERAISVESNNVAFKRALSVSSDTRRERTTSEGTEAEKEEDLPPPSIRRIMKMNQPEWPFITMGCIAALISGAIQPAFALIFAEILGVFSELDKDEQESKINFYSGMFAVIGVIAGLAMFIMSYSFARSGEHLTLRLREKAFYSILRQEIAFYDDDKNNTGALCTRLSTDASAVQGATGTRLGQFCSSLSSLGAGIIIGFVFSWKLTLVILAFAPFMLIAGFIEMRLFTGTFTAQKQGDAGKVTRLV